MSLLDDPASGLVRVRFLPTSSFAAELGIPPGAEGEVRARYRQDGRERLNVQVTGGCYASGVPADEVVPIERRRDQPDT